MNKTRVCMLLLGLGVLPGAGCGRMDDGGGAMGPGNNPGTCATGCQRGFTCRQGACALDGGALWDVRVTTGQVNERDPSGDAWDFPGGLPDPYACLTLSGRQVCTRAVQDTLRPAWNQSLGAATATGLMSGIRGSLSDEDVASNDPICGEGVIGISEDDLVGGRAAIGCSSGSFEISFRPM